MLPAMLEDDRRLTEFPHYGGIIAEPEDNAEGSCYVTPPVGDAPDDVIAYSASS